MKKLILGSISALALLTAAACSDSGTDGTTTQSVEPPADTQPMDAAPAAPEATPSAPADQGAGGADTGTMKPAEPAQ